jgi:hypothetical protein
VPAKEPEARLTRLEQREENNSAPGKPQVYEKKKGSGIKSRKYCKCNYRADWGSLINARSAWQKPAASRAAGCESYI